MEKKRKEKTKNTENKEIWKKINKKMGKGDKKIKKEIEKR